MTSEKKRAYDGSPLWTCKHCGIPKRRKHMQTHGGENVCKACHEVDVDTDRSHLRLPWLILSTPPKGGEQKRDRAIWKHVRPVLCYYRMGDNRKNFDNAKQKNRVFGSLFRAKHAFPQSLREPILRAMADYDLDPQVLLWLSIRDGIFDKRQMRTLAVEAAGQAVQFTGIAEGHPEIHGIMASLHRFIMDGNVQTLQSIREGVYNIHQILEETVYVKRSFFIAVKALSAACYRSSKDAVVVTVSYTHETLEREEIDTEVILSTLADIVREIARGALKDYELPDVEHWSGLEEV